MPVSQYAGVPVVMLSSISTENDEQVIEFDMVDEVTVTEENLVTQHPTEAGAALSDHIVVLPVSIRLSGRFVDFPLPEIVGPGATALFDPRASVAVAAVTGIAALASGNTIGRSVAMWRALEILRAQKELLTVNIQQSTYVDMAIKRLTGPRSTGDGGSQRFQIELMQVIKATATVVEAQNIGSDFNHSGGAVVDQGVKSAPTFLGG